MYWIISQVKGLAFPVQYRAAKVGPPVRYQSKICGYWCVLAVLYCRSSPALYITLIFSSYQHFAGGGSELLRDGLVGVGLLERFQGPHGEYVVVQLVGEANHSLPLLLVKGPLVKQYFLDGRSDKVNDNLQISGVKR